MAFESLTYEHILNEMLNRISKDYPNLDTREGSVLYNAVASSAIETVLSYFDLNYVLNQSFVPTASRTYLLMGCYQMGMDITNFNATSGTFKAEFNVEVPVGSRWNCDLYNFEVIEEIGLNNDTGFYEYQMLCETTGTAANSVTGELTPIDYTSTELTHAMLTVCLVEGENEATDDEIRKAYIEFVTSSVSDGNVDQYKRWCSEYNGIGKAKIFPLWNGANTVKVSILTSSNLPVDTSEDGNLVEKFQEYLDPGITGMGDGVAPIGAFVTVSTATAVPINVTANVKLASGYSESAMPDIESKLKEFFSTIAYDKSVVSFMSVGAAILDVPGVEFVSGLTLNSVSEDVILGGEEVPIIGTTSWTVVT